MEAEVDGNTHSASGTIVRIVVAAAFERRLLRNFDSTAQCLWRAFLRQCVPRSNWSTQS
jgi:hypothetical protein